MYLYVLIFLLILYFYFSYRKTDGKENFENELNSLTNHKYFKTMTNYNDIHDEFYSFYYDNLFFNEDYYKIMTNVYLEFMNNVYNNHLIIGIKHGGHINRMIDNTMQVTTISKSKNIIKKCNYNYEQYNFKVVEDYSSPYLFDNNQFTHISIIDDEIYYTTNIQELLSNCYEWLIHKGLLFIQVYDNKHHFKSNMKKINSGNDVVKKYVYSSNLQEIKENDYYFIEKIKSKSNKSKVRKNIHELTFYDNEYITYICKTLGLHIISTVNIMNNNLFMIFRKVQ